MKKLKGSLTIEAALVFPVFIMSLFALLFFMKILFIQEKIDFALSETANQMASTAYLLDKTGLLDLEQQVYRGAEEKITGIEGQFDDIAITFDQLVAFHPSKDGLVTTGEDEGQALFSTQTFEKLIGFVQNITGFIETITEDTGGILASIGIKAGLPLLNNAIGSQFTKAIMNSYISEEDYKKWGIVDGSKGMDYSGSKFLLQNEEIRIHVRFRVKMPIFRRLLGDVQMRSSVCTRAFTGNENFESMFEASTEDPDEEDEKKDLVYITAKSEVYHKSRGCRYIDVKVKAKTFGEINSSKRVCEICGDLGGSLNTLSIIYITDKSSIYHTTLECSEVKRTVFTIELQEAMGKGLRLCQNCKEEGADLDTIFK